MDKKNNLPCNFLSNKRSSNKIMFAHWTTGHLNKFIHKNKASICILAISTSTYIEVKDSKK